MPIQNREEDDMTTGSYEWYKGFKGDYVIPSIEFLYSEQCKAQNKLSLREKVTINPGTYINMLRCMAFELHEKKGGGMYGNTKDKKDEGTCVRSVRKDRDDSCRQCFFYMQKLCDPKTESGCVSREA
jgi:hypothetical protein